MLDFGSSLLPANQQTLSEFHRADLIFFPESLRQNEEGIFKNWGGEEGVGGISIRKQSSIAHLNLLWLYVEQLCIYSLTWSLAAAYTFGRLQEFMG